MDSEPSAEDRLKQSSASIPQTPAAPGTPQPSKAPAPPKHRKNAAVFIASGIVLVLIFALLGSLTWAVYAGVDIPVLTAKQENRLNIIYYRVPFLPKTPKQIIIAAAEANTDLTRYTHDFSMIGSVGSNAVDIASFDLHLAGPLDVTPESATVFDISAAAGVTFGGAKYSASGLIKKDGSVIYGKIEEISDSIVDLYTSFGSSFSSSPTDTQEITANLKQVFTNWIKYDMSGLETEARRLNDAQGGDSLIDTARQKALEVFFRDTVLPEITKLPDEEIEGVSTYHLQFAPSKDALHTIFSELNTLQEVESRRLSGEEIDQAVASIQKLQIDVYFGKSDALLRKVSTQLTISLDSLSDYASAYALSGDTSGVGSMLAGQLVDIKLSATMVLIVKDIGQEVSVVPPATTVSMQEYVKLLEDALVTEAERELDAIQKAYDEDYRLLTTAMTKYLAENKTYPSSLFELTIGEYIPSSSATSGRLGSYTYQRSTEGTSYYIYIEHEGQKPNLYNTGSTLYGITDSFTYPHYLTPSELLIAL